MEIAISDLDEDLEWENPSGRSFVIPPKDKNITGLYAINEYGDQAGHGTKAVLKMLYTFMGDSLPYTWYTKLESNHAYDSEYYYYVQSKRFFGTVENGDIPDLVFGGEDQEELIRKYCNLRHTIVCEECGRRIDEDDVEYIDDYPYCPRCVENHFVAHITDEGYVRNDECIQIHNKYGDICYIHETEYPGDYDNHVCERCEEYHHDLNMVIDVDGDYYCESCAQVKELKVCSTCGVAFEKKNMYPTHDRFGNPQYICDECYTKGMNDNGAETTE